MLDGWSTAQNAWLQQHPVVLSRTVSNFDCYMYHLAHAKEVTL